MPPTWRTENFLCATGCDIAKRAIVSYKRMQCYELPIAFSTTQKYKIFKWAYNQVKRQNYLQVECLARPRCQLQCIGALVYTFVGHPLISPAAALLLQNGLGLSIKDANNYLCIRKKISSYYVIHMLILLLLFLHWQVLAVADGPARCAANHAVHRGRRSV